MCRQEELKNYVSLFKFLIISRLPCLHILVYHPAYTRIFSFSHFQPKRLSSFESFWLDTLRKIGDVCKSYITYFFYSSSKRAARE